MKGRKAAPPALQGTGRLELLLLSKDFGLAASLGRGIVTNEEGLFGQQPHFR